MPGLWFGIDWCMFVTDRGMDREGRRADRNGVNLCGRVKMVCYAIAVRYSMAWHGLAWYGMVR